MVTLYFDSISPDKSTAISTRGNTILYNLNQLGGDFWDKVEKTLTNDNKTFTVFALHNYVCIVTMSLDSNEAVMILEDFKKDGNAARAYAKKLTQGIPKIEAMIMHAFVYTVTELGYTFPEINLATGEPPFN